MGKFCMYCGRELMADEVCNCREKRPAQTKTRTKKMELTEEIPTRDWRQDIVKVWQFFRRVFLSPATEVNNVVAQEKYVPAVIFFVVKLFLIGLYVHVYCLNSYGIGMKFALVSAVKVSIILAVSIGVRILIIKICMACIKQEVSLAKVLNALVMREIVIVPGAFLSLIIAFVNVSISSLVMESLMILAILFEYLGIRKLLGESDNKAIYVEFGIFVIGKIPFAIAQSWIW